MTISDQGIAILREIQRDATLSLVALSERTHVPQSTLWRRLQELERSGVIKSRVALLDPKRAGCALTVLAVVTLRDHAQKTVDGFATLLSGHPEIAECLATSGAYDYHLKIRVADVEAYERFMTHTLLRSELVRTVHSTFVLKELKATTELPL
jgi:Lrp/AsnC family transcriptional regulator